MSNAMVAASCNMAINSAKMLAMGFFQQLDQETSRVVQQAQSGQPAAGAKGPAGKDPKAEARKAEDKKAEDEKSLGEKALELEQKKKAIDAKAEMAIKLAKQQRGQKQADTKETEDSDDKPAVKAETTDKPAKNEKPATKTPEKGEKGKEADSKPLKLTA